VRHLVHNYLVRKQRGEFVLKVLNADIKLKGKRGYVLHVANQTETSFQLIDKITVGGKLTDVVYQFQKKQLKN
jgi:hypothetical protein